MGGQGGCPKQVLLQFVMQESRSISKGKNVRFLTFLYKSVIGR